AARPQAGALAMNDADVLFPWEKHGGNANHHECDPDTADTAQAGPTPPDTADTRPAAGVDDVHEEQAAIDADRTPEQSAEAAPADTVSADATDAAEDDARFAVLDTEY